MKKIISALFVLFTASMLFAQNQSQQIKAENIKITGDAAFYFKVPEGEYFLKAKGSQIIFTFELEKVKEFDIDDYIKYHPNREPEKLHLTFDAYFVKQVSLYDEDGFKVSDKEFEMMIESFDNDQLFAFLRQQPVGSKITVKCVACIPYFKNKPELTEEDIASIMKQKVTTVEIKGLSFHYYY